MIEIKYKKIEKFDQSLTLKNCILCLSRLFLILSDDDMTYGKYDFFYYLNWPTIAKILERKTPPSETYLLNQYLA